MGSLPEVLLENMSVRAAQAQEYVQQLIADACRGELVDGFRSACLAAATTSEALETIVPYMARRIGGMLEKNYRLSVGPFQGYTAIRYGKENTPGLALESITDCSCTPDLPDGSAPEAAGILQKTGYCTPIHHGTALRVAGEDTQLAFFEKLPSVIEALPVQLHKDADPAILEDAASLMVRFATSVEELNRIQKKYLNHSPQGLNPRDLEVLNAYQVASGKRIDCVSWLAAVNLAEQYRNNLKALRDATQVLVRVLKPLAVGKSTKVGKVTYSIGPTANGEIALLRYADKLSTPRPVEPASSPFGVLREVVGNAQSICRAFGLRDVSLIVGKSLPGLGEQ